MSWALASITLAPLLLAAIALLPGMRRRNPLLLLPWAPVPGLLAALFAPEGTRFVAADVLLGATLAVEGHGRLFLGFAAFLWLAAGVFAQAYLRGDPRRSGFTALWCLTLAGSLGVFIAADVATFYVCFACVSLAAYPLVAHTRSPEALRAGLVYIVLAVIGEVCLLLAFMLAANGADSLLIADLRTAVAGSPWQASILLLLLAGFGIKVGLFPLHFWLPLAHPAAPTPASAVLSGAMVKAGIFGLMQFLPVGTALPHWHALLLWLGLFTAFYGVAIGLTQRDPKAVLAYSTVSQMGLVVALIGTALQADSPTMALAAASLYALHHGLAKGALFLGVGIIQATGRQRLRSMRVLLALPALSLAGFPLSGGALAKLAAKPSLGGGVAEWLFTLSAIGTALLMLRLLRMVKDQASANDAARPAALLLVPWLATVAAALLVPWWLFAPLTVAPWHYPLSTANLFGALWPLLLAGAIAALARTVRWQAPAVAPGDLITLLGAAWMRVASIRAVVPPWTTAMPGPSRWRALGPSVSRWIARMERLLSRWSISGVLLLALVVLAAL